MPLAVPVVLPIVEIPLRPCPYTFAMMSFPLRLKPASFCPYAFALMPLPIHPMPFTLCLYALLTLPLCLSMSSFVHLAVLVILLILEVVPSFRQYRR